jgi:PTS system galactitol-specific IIC component
MFYLFPVVLPITKGNVVKTFVVGLVALICGLYFVTNIAEAFTMAANSVAAMHPEDASVRIPEGFSAGAALDFASSLMCWLWYHVFVCMKWLPVLAGMGMAYLLIWNRKKNKQ